MTDISFFESLQEGGSGSYVFNGSGSCSNTPFLGLCNGSTVSGGFDCSVTNGVKKVAKNVGVIGAVLAALLWGVKWGIIDPHKTVKDALVTLDNANSALAQESESNRDILENLGDPQDPFSFKDSAIDMGKNMKNATKNGVTSGVSALKGFGESVSKHFPGNDDN